ncbi:hypothetical protein [Nitrosophilus kaiyonis]|uniref:hypothetical protein n=1 Tax=Nitrosophilus kaiyonis TaxID=2930200 RepID=UPI00249024CA|nr:hypothetical protein [Nitrosophilus kaiyonis]
MLILEKEKSIFTKLKDILEIENYKFYRYKIPFCLLIIECREKNCLHLIKAHIRKTDTSIKLNKNLYGIIFRYIDIKNGGHKAAENLIHYLEKNITTTVYGGLSCSDENMGNIINRALFALKKAKNKNFSNIEDDYLF